MVTKKNKTKKFQLFQIFVLKLKPSASMFNLNCCSYLLIDSKFFCFKFFTKASFYCTRCFCAYDESKCQASVISKGNCCLCLKAKTSKVAAFLYFKMNENKIIAFSIHFKF